MFCFESIIIAYWMFSLSEVMRVLFIHSQLDPKKKEQGRYGDNP